MTINHPMQLVKEVNDWRSYVAALKKCDVWWIERSHRSKDQFSVLGEESSWLHTILTGREVSQLPNWENLTQRECDILRGRNTDEGSWALLGDIIRPTTRIAFNPEKMPNVGPARERIHHHVKQVLTAPDNEIARVAHEAVQEIMLDKVSLNGFSHASATRLLTLARPDFLVSVNGASAAGLGRLISGKPRKPAWLAKRYDKLLKWVCEQPWFKAPRPAEPDWKRDIWDCRAALLDAFVYEQING